jgi:hypothetical protein
MSVMDQKSVTVVARYGLPQLLDRPFGSGMFSHTDANDAPGRNLYDYQYI